MYYIMSKNPQRCYFLDFEWSKGAIGYKTIFFFLLSFFRQVYFIQKLSLFCLKIKIAFSVYI